MRDVFPTPSGPISAIIKPTGLINLFKEKYKYFTII